MITQLTIRNFQAHRKTQLRFSPHVTTIVGPTDTGKSAILRAIRWVVTNQPSGDGFVRHGSKQTSVTLRTSKHLIKRTKGKGNHYFLDGKRLTAFGKAVPDVVIKSLRLGDINFQRQYDSPYWFTDSPGQVSRNLNSIVDLSLMDRVLSSLVAKQRQARERVEIHKEMLRSTSKEAKKLSFIKRVKKEFDSLLSLEKTLKERESNLKRLSIAIKQAISVRSLVGQPPPSQNLLKRKARRLSGLLADCQRLESLLHKAETFIRHTKDTKQVLIEAEKEFHRRVKGKACPICGNTIIRT